MAAAFASLPVKVLWRLFSKEIPDAAAMTALRLANNTKVMHQPSTLPAHNLRLCLLEELQMLLS